MNGEHKIKTDPFVIAPHRRVAVAVRESLKDELDNLEKMHIIKRIEEPTEWVSNLVVL